MDSTSSAALDEEVEVTEADPSVPTSSSAAVVVAEAHPATVLQNSILLRLGAGPSNFLTVHALSYLRPNELLRLASVCRDMRTLSSLPYIWHSLLAHDFSFEAAASRDNEQFPDGGPPGSTLADFTSNARTVFYTSVLQGCLDGPAASSTSASAAASAVSSLLATLRQPPASISAPPPPAPEPSYSDPQALYKAKLEEVRGISRRERCDKANALVALSALQREDAYGSLLDLTQLYLLVPLAIVAVACFLALLALHFDGGAVSAWGAFAPLFVLLGYTLLCVAVQVALKRGSRRRDGPFGGLWEKLCSPIKMLLEELRGKEALFALSQFLLFLLQMTLVAYKLALPASESANTRHSWGVIFLPVWLMLASYCAAPCVGCITSSSTFAAGAVLLWLPAFVFFVCITLRTDSQDGQHGETTSPYHYENLRLALVFIPLFIIEAAVMLSTLGFFCMAWYRQRLGYIDAHVGEMGGACLLGWFVFGGFMTFQVLLCLKTDANEVPNRTRSSISAMDVVTPLLVLLGWTFVVTVLALANYQSPFKTARAQRLRQTPGSTVVFADV